MIIIERKGMTMVLKKPYAFLIKHFKIIHLLLSIPLIYLVIRTGAITSFLSSYVSANYYTNITNIAGTYINYFMYLAMILILILVIPIYFLMKKKEKDTKLYFFIILYYLGLFVLVSVSHNAFVLLEAGELESQTVRAYRDISFAVYLPQFFFIAYTLMRGIGFDLKKFNFEEDVKELEITDVDNEEFELVFGKDAYKYKRPIRRFIREFRYYFLENKFIFSLTSAIIVILIGTLLYLNYGVYHKTFRQTQKMSHNGLTISVVDSVLSNLDLGGNIIDGKYYIAIALKIKNGTKEITSLDYENFRVEVANRSIMATLDRSSYFADLGIPYKRDTKLMPNTEDTYVLTYEIENELINKPIVLHILESIKYEIGSVTPIYKNVNLKYDIITENKEIKTTDFNKILELSKTRLGLVQIQLKKAYIKKSYEYTYNNNLKNRVSASSSKKLLVLENMFSIDKYTEYYKARHGASSFATDFLKVSYEINNQKKIVKIVDKTPKELLDTWVLEIPEEVSYGKNLELIVGLRGSIYKMSIKL